MRLIELDIITDSITHSGQTFSLDGVVSFTINNFGNTDAYIKYSGKGILMKVDKGTSREFNGTSGFIYRGEMRVDFIGADTGLIEVVKSITSRTEI